MALFWNALVILKNKSIMVRSESHRTSVPSFFIQSFRAFLFSTPYYPCNVYTKDAPKV